MAANKDGTISHQGYDSNGDAREVQTDVIDGADLVRLDTGVANSGAKVFDTYPPADRNFLSWFFGSDGAFQALTVNADNDGLWLDMSVLNSDLRQIVIVNEDGTSRDYGYDVEFSRNGLGDDADDVYAVTTVAAGAKAAVLPVALPASDGYDLFCRVMIKPTAAQAGTQLNFKAYLVGRGG